jgi:hypothetical protein
MTSARDLARRALGPADWDAGCDRCFDGLDEYAERELAGQSAAELYPDIAAHLAACPDCAEDYASLADVLRSASDAQ